MLISASVREKLKSPDHNVTEAEIEQCFASRGPKECKDTRDRHMTNPVTRWFVAETDYGRRLKVMYMLHEADGIVEIKSAYPATENVLRIYEKFAT